MFRYTPAQLTLLPLPGLSSGLYGPKGILPAQTQLDGPPTADAVWARPSLLWLRSWAGLDTGRAMDLLCLLGAGLSLAALGMELCRVKVVFAALLLLYGSLVQVGQVSGTSRRSMLSGECGFESFTSETQTASQSLLGSVA